MNALSPAESCLVRVSAAVAAWSVGDALRDDVGWTLRMARDQAEPAAVEEVLLQSYLFLGYPAALNALDLWREVSGVPAPGSGEGTEPDRWAERGHEVCARVYGSQYDALRQNVRRLHPDVERWMVVEGYGKVLGRPGLDLRVRELCVVALLAVTDWPTQLYSHLRGALNSGARVAEVEAALDVALAVASPEAGRVARATWERVLARRAD